MYNTTRGYVKNLSGLILLVLYFVRFNFIIKFREQNHRNTCRYKSNKSFTKAKERGVPMAKET